MASSDTKTHISYLLVVAAAVVLTFSDAIVVVFIVVLGQVHDAVCVAARVGEPDSSPVTAAAMADSRNSRSLSLTGPVSPGSLRLQCTNISWHIFSCARLFRTFE
jgi:hypothetical protein